MILILRKLSNGLKNLKWFRIHFNYIAFVDSAKVIFTFAETFRNKMKNLFLLILTVVALACNRNNQNSNTNLQPGVFAVTVVESVQTSKYTYLKVLENNELKWLAVAKMEVKDGENLFYINPYRMDQFKSPELGKVFDVIYFVDQISDSPETFSMNRDEFSGGTPAKASVRKYELNIEPVEGSVSIQTVYSNSQNLRDKEVTVTGKVVHYNPGIMDRNWLHIQDGTECEGKYDLTVTTNQEVKVGDVVVVKGKVETNADYGAGYTYEVIITGAEVQKR